MTARRKGVAGGMTVYCRLPAPNPKQREFLLARCKYIAYGGARAGGKSWAVRAKALLGALTNGGIRILIMRRTYPELESTMIAPFLQLLGQAVTGEGKPAGSLVANYNATQRTVFFANGSVVKFGHLLREGTLTEYQGQEYDWIFMDEATHFTEYEFRTLGACLRGVTGFPKRMYLTCNPGGVGHQWVKRLFVSREYRAGEDPKDYLFIPATVEDNTALSQEDRKDYIASLELLPEDIRAAHRYGDWDALSGQYFSEFRRDSHVIAPVSLPPSWPRYRAFDYGLDMFACYWAAVDQEGRIWIYREYCESGLIVSQAAQAMLALTPPQEHIVCTIAPPDIWSTQKDTGRTMAEVFAQNGIGLVKASGQRVQGWMMVKEFLKKRPDGRPGLLVFDTCNALITNLPALLHSPKNPSDVATEPHDLTHQADALRYLCVFRAMGASRPRPEAEEEQRGTSFDETMTGGAVSADYLGYG